MRREWTLSLIVALLAAPWALSAQIRRAGQTGAESSDTTGIASTDSSTTERLLAVEGQAMKRVPVQPRVGFGDLQPVGSRIVLTRDSIEWLPARTVGELIAAVAPAYLWRGGWLLRPEVPNVMGRGAGSIEYFQDGLPVLAVGPDSASVDPTNWSLNFLERVEMERLPGRLRVFLFSRVNDRAAPATRIGISTGDRGFARYVGAFDRRFESGVGIAVSADYSSVDAPEGGTGGGHLTNALVALSWQINSKFGTELSIRVSAPELDPLLRSDDTPESYPDTLDPGLSGRRTDTQLRLSWRSNPAQFGLHLDGWLAKTEWSSDSVEQAVGTLGATIGYRKPTTSIEAQLLHRTEWTPLDAKVALGWAPTNWLSGSTEFGYQRHVEERKSKWVTARLGAQLPLGLSAGVTASSGERVVAPAITDLEATSFTDYEAFIGGKAGPLTLEGRITSTDVWQPIEFRQFSAVASLARQPRTEWLGLKARLAPSNWFSIASHYEHPQGFVIPDGVPPHHAWTTATVNSRFLRNFPSGLFRLKVQAVVETWSPGVIGRDGTGEAISIPGLTFVRGILQLQIGSFTAFWDRVNFQGTDGGTVPGYPIFSLGSSYGIRWSFSN